MKIKVDELEKLIKTALLKKFNEEDSSRIADVIMFGELSGKKSHGIVRLIVGSSSMLAQKPTGSPKIKEKTKFSKIIEGKGNPAMLVGSLAMEEVIKIAKEHGFGIVGTCGTFSTSGCLSYYLGKIGQNDLIGIIMARSPLCIAPFNSIEPLFGTNPIGFAIPAKPRPLIFDMGTSAISYGAILDADATGKELPKNVAIDKEGNVTTDPKKAFGGAILTFDRSYKSSGLAMIVEVLSGVLPGAGFIDIKRENDWGNTFIAFSPNLLTDVFEFKEKMYQLVERVKNSKTRDGRKIRIPGETTIRARDKALKLREVEVAGELIEKIRSFVLNQE